jgi:hypothetical protein
LITAHGGLGGGGLGGGLGGGGLGGGGLGGGGLGGGGLGNDVHFIATGPLSTTCVHAPPHTDAHVTKKLAGSAEITGNVGRITVPPARHVMKPPM